MKHSLSKSLLSCAALMTLAGCAVAAIQEATDFMFADPVNLKQYNYATADFLASQIDGFVNQASDVIKAEPLVDIDQTALKADVGYYVPAQIGERLKQLGYQMDLSKVTPMADTLHQDSARHEAAKFVMDGHYQRNRASVDIHLRVQELATGQVITTYHYNVPFSKGLKKMSTPDPVIVKMPPGQAVSGQANQ